MAPCEQASSGPNQCCAVMAISNGSAMGSSLHCLSQSSRYR
jgi:hypothetical protein